MKRISLPALVFIMTISGIALMISILIFLARNEKIATYVEAEGTVTSLTSNFSGTRYSGSSIRRHSSSRATVSPIYTYYVNGNEYNVSSDLSSSIPPEIGSKKIIKYNPLNPSEAIVDGFAGIHLVMLGACVFFFGPLFIYLVQPKE